MTTDLSKQMRDARKNVNAIKRIVTPLDMHNTFLDCGANIGEVSLEAAKLFGKVIAVEAHPDTAKVLRARTKAVKSIRVLNLAVTNETGQQFFVSSPSHCAIGATARAKPRRDDPKYYKKVPTVSLLDLLEEHRPSVIKMDIEGSEFDALRDIKLPARVRYLIVEFHGGPEKIAPIISHVKKQGFTAKGFERETNWKLQTIEFTRVK